MVSKTQKNTARVQQIKKPNPTADQLMKVISDQQDLNEKIGASPETTDIEDVVVNNDQDTTVVNTKQISFTQASILISDDKLNFDNGIYVILGESQATLASIDNFTNGTQKLICHKDLKADGTTRQLTILAKDLGLKAAVTWLLSGTMTISFNAAGQVVGDPHVVTTDKFSAIPA